MRFTLEKYVLAAGKGGGKQMRDVFVSNVASV
jgi:hypothetical protein